MASPHSCGTFLVFKRSFIKLAEHPSSIDLNDLTYIFVIFVARMEKAEVN